MRRTPSSSRHSCVALLTLAVLSPTTVVLAQDPGPPETVVTRVETHQGINIAIPQPPRALFDLAPIGGLPPVPSVDAGLPQPLSRPCVVGDLEAQPANGAFTFFRNRDHRPVGGVLLHPGEPSVAALRDTWFASGNTYGSISRDSGMTWTYVNPYTLFPANDGGVCCDQRVIADPGSGLLLWYIQYRYSSTTGQGGFRLAWARNRDQLRAQTWNSIYLNGASFGLSGNWLDFPDIAVSGDHVYIATNAFNAASSYQNSLVIRTPISQIAQGGSIVSSYYRRTGGSAPMGGGASYRFAQTYAGNPAVEMFWASHNSTSSLRIFRWDDGVSGRYSDVDRTVPSWTSTRGTSVGPDGRDWLGGDDHRIASGYINPVFNEGGFLWSSNGNGGSRPQSYVRVQAFNPADRTIIATEDVWNGSIDFAYPAVGMNSLGHGGVVLSGGAANINVTTYALLSDNYTPFFAGGTLYALATGTNGSPSNRWGDYHSVVANPIDPRTFLATGMNMFGGSGTGSTVHRSVWFGRDDYTPAWVTLNVNSVGASGVPIVVDETDRNGLKNASTPLIRSYTPHQGYTLRAPAVHTLGGVTFLFVNWDGAAGPSTNLAYTVSSIGAFTQTATVNYGVQMSVTVDDRNVAAGVPITVGTMDLDGAGNGTTRFTRRYRSTDGPFSFTAPALAGAQPFRRWYLDGTAQPLGQRSISVSLGTGPQTIEAEYCSYATGGIVAYGTGCAGSNSMIPALSSTSRPDIGASVTYAFSGLTGPTPAVMTFGFSRTNWSGAPLPLSLGIIGANPACYVLAEALVTTPLAVTAGGNGTLTFAINNDPNIIGLHMYSQLVGVDVFMPYRVPLVVSNALDMTFGGSSLGGLRCP